MAERQNVLLSHSRTRRQRQRRRVALYTRSQTRWLVQSVSRPLRPRLQPALPLRHWQDRLQELPPMAPERAPGGARTTSCISMKSSGSVCTCACGRAGAIVRSKSGAACSRVHTAQASATCIILLRLSKLQVYFNHVCLQPYRRRGRGDSGRGRREGGNHGERREHARDHGVRKGWRGSAVGWQLHTVTVTRTRWQE